MNLNLTINLAAIAVRPALIRQESYQGPYRERVSEEKYFRQAIQIYCKEGELEDSGFVQLNDFTDMCSMIRVLPIHKQFLHAFDCWEHYGTSFFKTEKFNIRDLGTGNFVQQCSTLPVGMPHNDLEKNEDYFYSRVLLETLEEYSESNMPELVLQHKKQFEEIAQNCTRDFELEPTESELIQRAEFKVRAHEEIAKMFIIKALVKTKTLLAAKLLRHNDMADIEQALIGLEPVFIDKQRAQDGPEIEKAFIEAEVERLTREIPRRYNYCLKLIKKVN